MWAPDGVKVVVGPQNEQFAGHALVSDGAGGAIIAGNYGQVVLQHMNSAGSREWGDGGVAMGSASIVQTLALTGNGAGGATVGWQEAGAGTGEDIHAQSVDSLGTPLWALGGVTVCDAPNDQMELRGTADGSGGMILAWRDERAGSTSDIYAQRIAADGSALWSAGGQLVCGAPDYQFQPAPVSTGDGGAIIAWADARAGFNMSRQDVYAQRVANNGVPVWQQDGVPVRVAALHVGWQTGAVNADQGAVFVWNDGRNDQSDIYAQNVNADGSLGEEVAVPTILSVVSADYSGGRAHVVWYGAGLLTAKVYRQADTQSWQMLAEASSNGTGRIDFVDAEVVAGKLYRYRLGVLENGREMFLGEASVEVPSLRLGLNAFPNPTRGLVRVSLELPDCGLTKIDVLSASGRRVMSKSFVDLAPGVHVVELSGEIPLGPGVYFVRVLHGGHWLSRRVAILR